MRPQFRFLAIAVVVSTVCLDCALASNDEASAPVTTALDSLQKWIGSGPNGNTWAKYLQLDALRAQLAKGADADPAVVDGVLQQFEGPAKGLELPKFRSLRNALAAWSEDLSVVQAGGLSEAALGAQSKFAPITAEDAAQAKAKLESALAKLNAYLTGDNGQRWRAYLRLDQLADQLQSESPRLDELAGIYNQFTADQVGLETPVFANAGTALDQYISVVAANRDDLKQQYAAQLKTLAEALNQYSDDHSEELATAIGTRLGWLQRMRQARGLVRAVRRRYSNPNLYVAASARLVAAGIEQDVDDNGPVRDYILGTDISGTGHTVGSVSLKLVPSEENAMLEILLAGRTITRTVGYNGPATVYTNGNVEISGSKRIVIDATGFKSYPAKGHATARTQITGVGARHKMVQRIASRRAAKLKPQAERIGSDHAGDRVRDRVEEQSGSQLSEAHANYVTKFRKPLLRRREFPELLRFRTTEDYLLVTGMKANRMQLAAPGEPPTVDGDHDLVVRVHESMINNLAAAMLSGVTLKEEEVQQQVIELRGELPEKLKSDPDKDPWSITFASSRPVTVKFAEDGFEFTIRGQRYTSGDRDFRAMNITAKYKAEISGNGARLVRQGDLSILPPNFVPGKSRLSSQQITLRTLLERRFGDLFEAEIKSEGLELPGNWKNAGRLDLKVLQSKAGWLAMAWLESGEPVKEDEPAEAKDKVAFERR
jgi:hypothetical protein